MTGKEAINRLKKEYDYRNEYVRNNYDRISVTVPRGMKDRLKAVLDKGESINGIISEYLIDFVVSRENRKDMPFS